MKTRIHQILFALALCLIFGAAPFTHAQNLTLDDFSAGPYKVTLPNSKTAMDTNTQTDNTGMHHIYGGTRTTFFKVCNQFPCNPAADPFAQTATLQIRPKKAGAPAALVVSGGYKTFSYLADFYGSSANPLQLDLTPYDRLRVSFDGLSQVVVVILELFSPTGNSAFGCTLNISNNTAFTADFPIQDFVGAPTDLKHISLVGLITDGTSLDYGITKFEAVPASAPPATFACPPPGSSRPSSSANVGPDFSLTTTPIILRHVAVASRVALAPTNGFNGTVALSCTSPQVTQCSVSPASIAGSGTAILSLSSDFAGTYLVTLTGTSGNLIHSKQVAITVPCSTMPCE